jgi:hypothetical protein
MPSAAFDAYLAGPEFHQVSWVNVAVVFVIELARPFARPISAHADQNLQSGDGPAAPVVRGLAGSRIDPSFRNVAAQRGSAIHNANLRPVSGAPQPDGRGGRGRSRERAEKEAKQ